MLTSKINGTQHLCKFSHCGFFYIFHYQQLFILFISFNLFYCNDICMAYVMLLNWRVILFFLCPIVESFEKGFMYHFAVACVIIDRTTIITNTLKKHNIMKSHDQSRDRPNLIETISYYNIPRLT